jgi:protein phosphatase
VNFIGTELIGGYIMERIAIISDIHGNIPALEAVLLDIKARDISRIICLGDMVGKGPHSEVAVDMVKEACELVVTGNWDEGITKPQENEAIKWHQARLGTERFKYLESLPFSHDFFMSGKLIRLFHASSSSVHTRIYPWSSFEERLAMFEHSDLTGDQYGQKPDVVGYGDIHYAFLQHINDKALFNAGSVGNPLEVTQASYAILEGIYNSRQPGPFSIQFVRVPYDVELSIQQAKEENMPYLEEYIMELRTAVYRGNVKKSSTRK